jgi:integration host factor subunit alpha
MNSTITRESLARAVKRDTGLPINKALELIDKLFRTLSDSLQKGEEAKIRMFGSFSIKHKNARIGRNPKNLVEAVIPERNVVKFKVAPTLKKRINSNIKYIA